jgi:putative transposase
MIYYKRNLPHWLPEGKHIFVTWRLYGSLPAAVLTKLRKNKEREKGKHFVHFDTELDRAAFGPKWLRDDEVAAIVQREILAIQQTDYGVVHSYVIMPNHVHLVLEPKVELRLIMQSLKGRSARACNCALRRQGLTFWQDESFDHWVRSTESLGKILRYIEWNPVSVGLVKRPDEWRWSSAYK